uniref:Uncharacterized protein n=1 Tax=Acrobeloides nanus TaxID=290746 RepID=A0A914C0Q7_9BILA
MFNRDSDFEELWQLIESDNTTPQQQSNIPRSPVYNMDPELSMDPNMKMKAGYSNSPNSRSVQTYEDLVALAELSEDDRRFLASSSTMGVETKPDFSQPFYELMGRSEDFTQNYHAQPQLSNLDGSSDGLFSPASMTISSPRSTGTASSPVKLPSFEESFSPQICQPQTSASNYHQFAYAQPNASSNCGYAQPAYPGNDERMQLATPKKPTKRQPSNSSAPSPTKRGKGAPTNEYYFENQPFTAENYKEFFENLSAKQKGFTIFEFTPLKIDTEEGIREHVQKTEADVQIWNGSYYEKTVHELENGAQFAGSDIKKRIKANMYMRNYNKKKRHTLNSRTVATAENLRSLEPNLHEFLQMEAKTQQLEAERQNYILGVRNFILKVQNLEYDTPNDRDQVLNAVKEFCLYNETEIHDTL